MTDFIFLASKTAVDGDCRHKIKRYFLLGRKAMTNLDIIFKKEKYYSAYKGLSSQKYVFSVVMYKYESWTIKKSEH